MAKLNKDHLEFLLKGQKQETILQDNEGDEEYFSVTESYDISDTRGVGEEHKISLGDNDFVQLTFDDDTTWFGNQVTLLELFPGFKDSTRAVGELPELPKEIKADGDSRSWISELSIKLFKKFSKKAVDAGMIKLAETIEKKSLDGRSGLYQLNADFTFTEVKNLDLTQPVLLFIHGTISSTKGSFAELQKGEVWQNIQKIYGNNILAFEHESLTKSPLKNACELINKLPDKVKLHLVSHSRGGLVGEILARFAEDKIGFLEVSIDMLKDEGRQEDLDEIKKIQNLMTSKNFSVEKFVRVACPARGTSILGKRMDIFLNVIINLINVSSGPLRPVVAGLKSLISQAVETKNDEAVLPGLEAMNPDSVFLKALNTGRIFGNSSKEKFFGKLSVISGSSRFSVSLNGLKVVLTKFFFKWEQNDLVVDTSSMYLGARRRDPIQYFLDDGTNVNHFNYFENKKTQDALYEALISSKESISTFKEMTVEDYAALDRGIFGLEGGKLAVKKAEGKKPIVLLLPGIMGSFLEEKSKPLWINYLAFAFGGLTKLSIENNDIDATGIIKSAYKDLAEFLGLAYDVEVFPFDWRKPVKEAGDALAERVTELQAYNQPVHLVGHSMGGLVIRDMAINHEDVWTWLNNQKVFRAILLGTPWMGSYRIANVLSGRDSIINQLSTIDIVHSKTRLINMFVKFPGLLALLPIRREDIEFGSNTVWEEFQAASGLNWEKPTTSTLNDFANFKNNILTKLENLDHKNIIYVAGRDEETVDGYTIENGELKFSITGEGDQSVPWETGIPKLINRDTSLYYTNATHGGLSQKKFLFQGIKDLLDKGTTTSNEFSRVPLPVASSTRGMSKEKYSFEVTEKNIEAILLGLGTEENLEETNTPILKLSVAKGDMIYATYPLLMGHFAQDGLYNSELVADKYMKQNLSYKHALNIYPGNIGSHSMFLQSDELFKGCIVCGLGQAEYLNAFQLSKTIESAVADYLLSLNNIKKENNPVKRKIGLSSLIIGAGYGGMPIESSVRAIMQGIVNANQKVLQITNIEDLYVDELEFIELFEDKAISCFYCISNLVKGNSDGMNLAWMSNRIKNRFGARKRIFIEDNPGWWQRLSVITNEAKYDSSFEDESNRTLYFYSSTNNAREEKKELHYNMPQINSLLNEISIKKSWSADKARAIFELLIPTDFKQNIRRNSPILWVLDKFTASFPWELLQTGNTSDKPLCVSSPMIRQLATGNYKDTPAVKNNNVLIIGDPDLEGLTKANQLPGAEREAQVVYKKLSDYTSLNIEGPIIKGSSDEILTALFKQDYKILHLAGHGVFNEKDPYASGMLIGKRKDRDEPLFLTAQNISQLPSTPEFVFINCCFLGRINPYAEEFSANRFKLAANLGTQLIENGVKAVVIAGWEVDDKAALKFAETFYEKMLSGQNFGDAVHSARQVVYKEFPRTNTWGAFQCYGQQHYKFRLGKRSKGYEGHYEIPQVAANDLENLLSKTEVVFYEPDDLLKELITISKKIKDAKFVDPDLKQKEAQSYQELNEFDTAIKLYEELFNMEDASFDVKSLENYQSLCVNNEIAKYFKQSNSKAFDFASSIAVIDKSLKNLENLLGVSDTGHRHTLIASAYKRKSFILPIKPKDKGKIESLELSALHYYKAYKKGKDSYSFCNWINLESFLTKLKKQDWGNEVIRGNEKIKLPSGKDIEKTLAELESSINNIDAYQNYWEQSEIIDIVHCRYLQKPTKKNFELLSNELNKLWKVAGSKNKKYRQLVNLKLQIQFAEMAGLLEVQKDLSTFIKDNNL